MHPDHRTERRNQLLIAGSSVLAGIVLVAPVLTHTVQSSTLRILLSWIAGGALIGGGLLVPLKRPILGAIIGVVIQIAIAVIVMSQWADWPTLSD